MPLDAAPTRRPARLGGLRVGRRTVTGSGLLGGGLLLLTGCTDAPSKSDRDAASTSPPTGEDPDVALALDALTREQALVAELADVRRRHRSLRARLRPTVRVHLAHVELLADAADLSAATPSPEVTPRDPAASPDPPGSPVASVTRLARAELALGEQQTANAVAARSGTFARVLAGMAAAAAQQAAVLDALRSELDRPQGAERP